MPLITRRNRERSIVLELGREENSPPNQPVGVQTLAKGDKLTITAERIDGDKLRCTGATWSYAVVIFPGEVLAFQNIERARRGPTPW
jgi:hypothetical protein